MTPDDEDRDARDGSDLWTGASALPRFLHPRRRPRHLAWDARSAVVPSGGDLRLDRGMLRTWLLHDAVDVHRAFFQDLALAPARCPVRRRRGGGLAVGRGRAPRRVGLAPREAAEALRSAIEDAAERATEGASRVAVLLSGGLDSAVVAAAADAAWRRAGRPHDALAFVHLLPPDGPTEVSRARAVARHLGRSLREDSSADEDPLLAAEPLLAHLDFPLDGLGTGPWLRMLQGLRADGFDRVLTGDGGDELFEAYAPGAWPPAPDASLGRRLRLRGWWHVVAHGGEPVPIRRRPVAPPPWLAPGPVPRPRQQPAARRGLRGEAAWRDRTLRGARQGLLAAFHRATDRTTGLSTRCPLLDPAVTDLAVALPPSAFRGDLPKAIARRAFLGALPAAEVSRPKDQPAVEPVARRLVRAHGAAWLDRYLAGSALLGPGLVAPFDRRAWVEAVAEGPDLLLAQAGALLGLAAWCRVRDLGA